MWKALFVDTYALYGWQVLLGTSCFALLLFQQLKDSSRTVITSIESNETPKSSSDHRNSKEEEEELFSDENYAIENRASIMDGPCKMVFCVNMELGMGKGKIAAQCGHATLGAYKLSLKYSPGYVRLWESLGQAKIAVKVEKESELMLMYEKAKARGLAAYLVCDAGHTQIAAGSRTVLAIGPAPLVKFEGITDKCKLL